MSADLLALAMRRDAAAREELVTRLTSLRREPTLGPRARTELEALLRELRETVSPPLRKAIDSSLHDVSSGSAARNGGRRDRHERHSDDDLAALAMTSEPDRLVILARRPDLPPRISGIVAARGHLPALHALARNRSAAIGPSVLLALTELSLGDPTMRDLMTRRHDLPEEAVSFLWPHLSDEEKAAILSAASPYGGHDLDDIAEEAELRLHDALRKGELPESLDRLVATIQKGSTEPEQAVELLCADARLADLGELMARLLSAETLPCVNLLAMPSPRGAALLCRAAGLPRASYEVIAKLRRDLGWQAPTAANAGLDAFDGLSRSAARRILSLYMEATPE